jgi:phosphatidylglycerophosphate synthase
MNIIDLDLDKKYTEYVLSRTNMFEHIHPNVLSFFGLFTDFFIFYFLLNNYLLFFVIGMLIRYSCDCLDGAVARKYKKTSNLGGLLDTIADNTLIFILSYGLLVIFNSPYKILFSCVIVLLNVYYLIFTKSLIHHDNIKKRGNKFHNIYRFVVNNNCIFYTAYCILIFLLL